MIPFDLLSPDTGHRLKPDGAHALRDAETGARWPVIDGIPYLRTGRAELAAAALAHLDADRVEEALVLLLADQDDWWTGPPADPESLRVLVRERESVTLRGAVERLGWGRVGDYFVNRWTDPTFLAGLSLLEAHWNAPACAFELACGIGHYLRELQRRGVKVAGADVVFAKLWVARHWVVKKGAQLVCFDAAAPHWPIAEAPVDLVICNDAFYFLEDKPGILACLRRTAGDEGWLAVSHIHNSGRPGFSAGKAISSAEIEELFPDALVYDDAELTRALVEARAPQPREPGDLKTCEAFSVVAGPGMRPAPRAVIDGLTLPPAEARLHLNPLYAPAADGYAIRWPSERYEAEYATQATYPLHSDGPEAIAWKGGPDAPEAERVRRREYVDLPERW
ncbi:class I SAM-dependent methyltransferase [Methylobacterium sp. Leaf118]|uniref:class I SAM-dependent methyltransferase n=1 Tax=Methylobacterium sp. Leaf118 TaxID=2876562 RepID=UPI001E4743B0|nr:methyltransferase domain-containing protein [Methylobacterium sp. Leaf118]